MYGDAPPASVPSGLSAGDATRREFDAHSATIATTQSIRDQHANVTSLFSGQDIISNDVKLMSKASAQIREDMNLLLLNQQQIMAALKLPTLMIRTLPPLLMQFLPTLSNLHLLQYLITTLRGRRWLVLVKYAINKCLLTEL